MREQNKEFVIWQRQKWRIIDEVIIKMVKISNAQLWVLVSEGSKNQWYLFFIHDSPFPLLHLLLIQNLSGYKKLGTYQPFYKSTLG